VEDAASFIASLDRIHPGTLGAWYRFAIEERATGELVGDCGLRPDAEEPGLAELGFTLARRAQGKEFAREAIPAVLDYAGRRLGVRRIVAMTDARNAASVSLLEDLGLRRSDTRMVVFKGERCGEHEYRMDAPFSGRPS
jgi:RimJ/RimL family protein N-acetyltransferase